MKFKQQNVNWNLYSTQEKFISIIPVERKNRLSGSRRIPIEPVREDSQLRKKLKGQKTLDTNFECLKKNIEKVMGKNGNQIPIVYENMQPLFTIEIQQN